MCLAFCFFHDTFVVVYVSGVASISLTTIYGDRKLTGLVTLFQIVSCILLALFNRWDTTVVRDGSYYINVSLVVIVELCTYLISSMASTSFCSALISRRSSIVFFWLM